jgi:hypothetical protein
VTSAHISSSGECVVFGGSGGYLHLFAASEAPQVRGARCLGARAATCHLH